MNEAEKMPRCWTCRHFQNYKSVDTLFCTRPELEDSVDGYFQPPTSDFGCTLHELKEK